MSNGHKVAFLVIVTLGSFAASLLCSRSLTDPELFQSISLTSAQLGGFIAVFAALFLWIGAAGVVIHASLSSGEDFSMASQRFFSEETRAGISAAGELAVCLLLFFVCDRTSFLPRAKKHYDRDFFWFIWILLCLAAFATLRKAKAPTKAAEKSGGDKGEPSEIAHQPGFGDFHVKHLQRDQTEEWKGWMQIMFLWYHYFEAKELYNAIRLYIAAYVWMTGFGNFSYYYIKKDFSPERFLQMQWRLNFLVFWVCVILNNEYMLYYICMLHTTFTVIIWVGLGIMNHINQTFWGVCCKFAALSVFAFVMWDVNGVFEFVWSPLTFLVGYHDPYKTSRPVLHEWQFRSHLDHYVWIFGMFCAYNHPRIDGWLQTIDAMPRAMSFAFKSTITLITLLLVYVYVVYVFNLDKMSYNALHPYTSFIPIALYCVLRNISNTLRQHHLHLFEYLGKITLETYIAQFHIWMGTTGVNGGPKQLLRVLPKEWPLCNFFIMSALCIFVSMRLFHATNALKSVALPSRSSHTVLLRNLVWMASGLAVLLLLGNSLREITSRLAS